MLLFQLLAVHVATCIAGCTATMPAQKTAQNSGQAQVPNVQSKDDCQRRLLLRAVHSAEAAAKLNAVAQVNVLKQREKSEMGAILKQRERSEKLAVGKERWRSEQTSGVPGRMQELGDGHRKLSAPPEGGMLNHGGRGHVVRALWPQLNHHARLLPWHLHAWLHVRSSRAWGHARTLFLNLSGGCAQS